MPTVLRVDGFRFFFYSAEVNEPAHIHVRKAGNQCKYWLSPVAFAKQERGKFSPVSIKKIEMIINNHHAYLIEAFNEYHNG